jgi:hypothetical protein
MALRKRQSPVPIALLPVAERLREERARPTAQELDRAKLQAMRQAARPDSPRLRRGTVRGSRRVLSIALAIGLMSGGTAVIAKSGGPTSASSTSNGSSANSQYCPPSSQQPTKPKKPGPAKCGKQQGQ